MHNKIMFWFDDQQHAHILNHNAMMVYMDPACGQRAAIIMHDPAFNVVVWYKGALIPYHEWRLSAYECESCGAGGRLNRLTYIRGKKARALCI